MRRKALAIAIPCGCLILLGLLVIKNLGVFPLMFEAGITRRDIDNPYVNSRFDNWYEVNWHEAGTFMLPSEWKIQPNSNEPRTCILSSSSGDTIAYAAVYGTEYDAYQSVKEFAGANMGKNFEHLEIHNVAKNIAIADAAFYAIGLTDDQGNITSAYELVLNGDRELIIIFCDPPADEQYDQLFLISQAIAYSYYY